VADVHKNLSSPLKEEEVVFTKDSSFLKKDYLRKSEVMSNEDLMEVSTQNSVSNQSGHSTVEKQKETKGLNLTRQDEGGRSCLSDIMN
jgi:hypothetical protein